MNKKRQTQIEERATALLLQTGCYPANAADLVDNVGIDVRKVATSLGITLTLYDFGDDVSGVLLRADDKTTIGISDRTGQKRQRFTIAHELGHYVLDHQRQGVFVDTPEAYFTLFRDAKSATGEDFQEREANAFAAALLMPRNLLMDTVADFYRQGMSRDEDYELIPKLAKRFFVSELALSIRLTTLGLIW